MCARRERGGPRADSVSQKNEQRRPLPRWEAAVYITGDDDDGKITFNQSWLWLAGMCAVKEWAMATRQMQSEV